VSSDMGSNIGIWEKEIEGSPRRRSTVFGAAISLEAKPV